MTTVPIKIFGDIFLRLIQMSVPLIILGAVLEAVGQINPKELGILDGGGEFPHFLDGYRLHLVNGDTQAL